MEIETLVMQLIVNSGNAKSKAMEAIYCAKEGDFSKAKDILKSADEFLTQAHRFQTNLIQEEADGNIKNITILMVHAQDHLMNAITIIEMAREFVDLYENIKNRGMLT